MTRILVKIYSFSCCIKKKKLKTKKASKANAQRSSEYCSVSTRIIHILCFVYMLSHRQSKSILSCVLLNMSIMST